MLSFIRFLLLIVTVPSRPFFDTPFLLTKVIESIINRATMSLENKKISFVIGCASLGVATNIVVLRSCDLLRFGVSSLGLMSYADERRGSCLAYTSLDDPSLQLSQSVSSAALALGCTFLVISCVHARVHPVPGKDFVLTLLGASAQLAMLMVYSAKNNGICDVEGCDWGYGAVWNMVSQILYLAASAGSLYVSDEVPWNKQQQLRRRSIQTQILHQRRPSAQLEFGYGSA